MIIWPPSAPTNFCDWLTVCIQNLWLVMRCIHYGRFDRYIRRHSRKCRNARLWGLKYCLSHSSLKAIEYILDTKQQSYKYYQYPKIYWSFGNRNALELGSSLWVTYSILLKSHGIQTSYYFCGLSLMQWTYKVLLRGWWSFSDIWQCIHRMEHISEYCTDGSGIEFSYNSS